MSLKIASWSYKTKSHFEVRNRHFERGALGQIATNPVSLIIINDDYFTQTRYFTHEITIRYIPNYIIYLQYFEDFRSQSSRFRTRKRDLFASVSVRVIYLRPLLLSKPRYAQNIEHVFRLFISKLAQSSKSTWLCTNVRHLQFISGWFYFNLAMFEEDMCQGWNKHTFWFLESSDK